MMTVQQAQRGDCPRCTTCLVSNSHDVVTVRQSQRSECPTVTTLRLCDRHNVLSVQQAQRCDLNRTVVRGCLDLLCGMVLRSVSHIPSQVKDQSENMDAQH